MPSVPVTRPLLRLGRLELDPGLRAFQPGSAASGLVVVWAALHQDAIVVRLPDRTGPLAGQPAAALLRRGPGR
jgi:hypothetical protein